MIINDDHAYAEILRIRRPHVISSEQENEVALHEAAQLLTQKNPPLSHAEQEYLKLLTVLIEQYEEGKYQLQAAKPQEILRELMTARGMTQTELSVLLSSKGVASEVLAGKREVSKAQARRLGQHFHVSPALFLGF